MFNFTLKQIRYFEAVAKYGGLAQAARKINISQPAIAQAMDKLEENCGFQIFLRHHARGFELTAKGHTFLLKTQKLLRQAENIQDAIEDIRNDIDGILRIGCFQSIAPFCLASIICDYKEDHPGIKIEVSELLHDQLVSALQNREIDLAIMYDLGGHHPDLEFQTLFLAEPYVILPEGHKFKNQKRISLEDLKDEKYIMFDAPGSKEYFQGLFKQCGVKPDISFRSISLESVRSAVGSGLGFSVLSMRPPTDSCYDGSRVISLGIKDAIDPMAIVIAHHSDIKLDRSHENFIAYCKESFRGPKNF